MLNILLNILATTQVNILNYLGVQLKVDNIQAKNKIKKKAYIIIEKYTFLIQNKYSKTTNHFPRLTVRFCKTLVYFVSKYK